MLEEVWKIQIKSGNNAKNVRKFKNKPSMPLAFIRNNKFRLFAAKSFYIITFFLFLSC